MNNSPIVGIIICGPQGCGKTHFVRELLKNNKAAYCSVPDFGKDKENKQFLKWATEMYDLDVMVFDEAHSKVIKKLCELPNLAKIRIPYSVEERWLQRPLILVETNLSLTECIKSANGCFEVIEVGDGLRSQYDGIREEVSSKIFQFILSKTK